MPELFLKIYAYRNAEMSEELVLCDKIEDPDAVKWQIRCIGISNFQISLDFTSLNEVYLVRSAMQGAYLQGRNHLATELRNLIGVNS